MTDLPLVTIICLCYNHERFLKEALNSVLAQTYPNLEIIVVDDCSTDASVEIIKAYLQQYPEIKLISTGRNIGNCAAFNMGWRASSGRFIIDFATDDVLLPDRVTQQVTAFQKLDSGYGVMYTDAEYITDDTAHMGYHYKRNQHGKLLSFAPSGYIFKDLLQQYLICPPTMMIRREVLEDLGGYDEFLAYEDFDFWVRSSRKYKYFYLDIITTKRRVHSKSLSRGWYGKGNRLLASTVRVCEKAARLVHNTEEQHALAERLKYEARHAYLTGNFKEASQLLAMQKQNTGLPAFYKVLFLLSKNKINLSFVRKLYYRIKYYKHV